MDVFLLLILGHLLADYPLQGDFLSRAKNRAAAISGVPWWQAMGAHAGIHAGFVWLVTGSAFLCAAEFVIHAVTDDAKCRGLISYNQDQAIHIACKFFFAVAIWGVS